MTDMHILLAERANAAIANPKSFRHESAFHRDATPENVLGAIRALEAARDASARQLAELRALLDAAAGPPCAQTDLEPIRARLKAVDPRPLMVVDDCGDEPRALTRDPEARWTRRSALGLDIDGLAVVESPADAQLFAHAQADLAALLAEVERLRAAPPKLANVVNLQSAQLRVSIERLAQTLKTQDNASSADPQYTIQEKRRRYDIDFGNAEGTVWLDDEGNEVDCDAHGVEQGCDEEDRREVEEHGYVDEWVFLQAFLTLEAAERWADENKHRYGQLRVYVEAAYRNYEWHWLRALPAKVLDLLAEPIVVESTRRPEPPPLPELDAQFVRRVEAERRLSDLFANGHPAGVPMTAEQEAALAEYRATHPEAAAAYAKANESGSED